MTYCYQLTRISRSSRFRELMIDLNEAAELSDLHPEMIEEFLRGSLIQGFKDSHGKIYFDQAGISRLRKIAQLQQREHASLRTIRYIIGLLDCLDAREQELQTLRELLR
ncbi:MAG: hypothetical protein KJO21_10110 [Verrucomicrobiae bacterium]|nr:hypothetical protein [Verrucomicrobiae bacterium]NNJ43814.1 hypothetical protein [Akkermansiaceae bacterium]